MTYKWVWVGPDISCILLTNNLTSIYNQFPIKCEYFIFVITLTLSLIGSALDMSLRYTFFSYIFAYSYIYLFVYSFLYA